MAQGIHTARGSTGAALTAGLLLWTGTARGETYVVSPEGSDTNSGLSIDAPLATLQAAVDCAQPGDTVLVRAGTYRGRVEAAAGGYPGYPVVIRAPGNETAVLDGSRVVTGWRPWLGAVWAVTNWPVNSDQVFEDGRPLQQIGWPEWFEDSPDRYTPVGAGPEDLVPGSYAYATSTATLYVWPSDSRAPSNRLYEASVDADVLKTHPFAHDLRVENLVVRRGGKRGLFAHGGVTAAGCRFTWNGLNGAMAGRDCVIERCTLDSNGNSGVGWVGGHTNITVAACGVYSNNTRGFRTDWHAGGMKLIPDVSGTVVSNEVAWNYGCGIWVDACRSGRLLTVEANRVHHNRPFPRSGAAGSGLGIFVEISTNVLVRNNLVTDNDGFGLAVSGSDGIVATHNTIAGTRGQAALSVRDAGRVIATNPVPVYASLTGNRILNNLVYGNTCAYDLILQPDSSNPIARVADNLSDANAFYREGGARFLMQGGAAATSLGQWQSLTPWDDNSLSAFPALLNPPAGDWRLAAASPCIDAGTNGPWNAGASDGFGMPRTAGPRADIGWYEAGGATAETAPAITITGATGTVSYDIDSLGGWNNANVAGDILATRVAGGVTSAVAVVRTGPYTWRLDTVLDVGVTQRFTVVGTNAAGTPATDTVTVVRGGLGTGAPAVATTNAAPVVVPPGGACFLGGTLNAHVAGGVEWSARYGMADAGSGACAVEGGAWLAEITGLQPGWQTVTVRATNLWGRSATADIAVHAGPADTHYVSASSALPRYPYSERAGAARTLQAAVDAAFDGDTVCVGPGTYGGGGTTDATGSSRVAVRSGVRIVSEAGPGQTLIVGASPLTRCVLLDHADAALSGFTLAGGRTGATATGSRGGGLLALKMASVSNCVVRGCEAGAYGYGGGICLWNSGGTVTDCLVVSNRAAIGGGMHVQFGGPTRVANCALRGNAATVLGGGLSVDNTVSIENLLVDGNRSAGTAGGVALGNYSAMRFSTVERNAASNGSDGVEFRAAYGTPRVTACSLYGNGGVDVGHADGTQPGVVDLSCSRAAAAPGIDVTRDVPGPPLYVDADAGDFRPRAGSPCIDGVPSGFAAPDRDNRGTPRPLDGDGVPGALGDIGAFEYAGAHVDADGDGLDDAWEVEYGFNPRAAGEAGLDVDGDGHVNAEEYTAGTDPRDAEDVLRIAAIARTGTGAHAVAWRAAAGRAYALIRRHSLVSGLATVAWTGRFESAGDVTATNAAAGPDPGYYRLRVTWPDGGVQ